MANATVNVFGQIVNMIPRNLIQEQVKKHNSDKGAKGVSHIDVLMSLIFLQLSDSQSLRDVTLGMQSCEKSGYSSHTGCKIVGRSTLAYALAHRPYQSLEDGYYALLEHFAPVLKHKRARKIEQFKSPVYLVDSTTITLCLSLFPWAKYTSSKGVVKLHTRLDYATLMPDMIVATDGKVADVTVARDMMSFPQGSIVVMDRGYNDYAFFNRLSQDAITFITRLKDNSVHTSLATKDACRAVDDKGQWGDYKMRFTSKKAQAISDREYRVIQWYDSDNKRWFEFITNNFELSPEEIALLYHERWNIELFFKKIKQNLKIKSFLGTSFNAIMSQVWSAAIAVLLVEVLRIQSTYKWLFSNLVHNLRLNLLTFKSLQAWINAPTTYAESLLQRSEAPRQANLFEAIT